MKHTAKQMIPAIGATVHVATGVGDIVMTCKVQDVKSSWGNVRLLVEPILWANGREYYSGYGTAWVELSRLRRSEVSDAVAAV